MDIRYTDETRKVVRIEYDQENITFAVVDSPILKILLDEISTTTDSEVKIKAFDEE